MAGVPMSAIDRAMLPGIGSRKVGSPDHAGVLACNRPSRVGAIRKSGV